MKIRKIQLALAFMLVMTAMAAIPLNSATGTAGATGALTLRVDSATEGATMIIEVKSLTVSSTYSLELDDSVEFNWTTSSTETKRFITFVVPAPGADNALTIELVDGDVTVLDTAVIQVPEVDDLIPDGVVQAIFIALIGLFLFAGILIGIQRGLIGR